MDVWQITVAALRRWYILLPLLALTGYGTYTVGESVRPQYEVTATAILVPGTMETEIASPYGNMESTSDVLTILLGNTESRTHIAELGLDSDYLTEPRSRSSIIDFSVQSDAPETGLATGAAVLELAQQELTERQEAAGIPERAQIGLQILQEPSVSAVVADGKLRNMAIVGILGAAISLVVAVLFDDIVGLVRRRWRKRREWRAAEPEAATAPPPGPAASRQTDDVSPAEDEESHLLDRAATVPDGPVATSEGEGAATISDGTPEDLVEGEEEAGDAAELTRASRQA